MENFLASPWLFAVAGGALILGLAIAYGMSRSRKLTRTEKVQREAGTREIYKQDERGERV